MRIICYIIAFVVSYLIAWVTSYYMLMLSNGDRGYLDQCFEWLVQAWTRGGLEMIAFVMFFSFVFFIPLACLSFLLVRRLFRS